MEAVVITSVDGPNERGWFNVELEDGRTVTTKKRDLATSAMMIRGTKVLADITVKENGKFTNHYLNKIEAATAEALEEAASAPVPAPTPDVPASKNEVQERIARQWAYGRAVEALAAGTLDELLDTETFQKVQLAAENLLAATSK